MRENSWKNLLNMLGLSLLWGLAGVSQADSVTCESLDGKTRTCPIETRNGIRLVRQLSKTDCRRNDNWGVSRDNVWVSNGCRAEFESLYSDGDRDIPGQGRVTCESQGGKRQYCAMDTRRGVRLIEQLSKAECRKNDTWDINRDGIWVDEGCRGIFETGGWNGGSHGGGHRGEGRQVSCESQGGKRQYCGMDTRGGVRLVQQWSQAECRQGNSWGYDDRGVWVVDGCRGLFEAQGRGQGRDDGAAPRQLSCESTGHDRQRCQADTRGGVRLVRQLSRAECRQGDNWDYDRDGIWVDDGCRALFEIGGRWR